jgi:hypothetical protein
MRFDKISVGAQVVIGTEVHDHRVATFVPYFCVENLATLLVSYNMG